MEMQIELKIGQKFIILLLGNSTQEGEIMSSKHTDFRVWLNRKWLEHKDEIHSMNQPLRYESLADYFHQYRWWLRSQFKKECSHSRIIS